ncbi:hypothetical protein ACHAXS_005513 [Conticribra weissflogii]
MHRKQNLTTNAITKYKAQLNIHGGKQVYGMNYYKTYTPVVTWSQCPQAIRWYVQFYSTYTLIDAILDVGLKDKYKKPVPTKASLHLHAFKNSPTFDKKF